MVEFRHGALHVESVSPDDIARIHSAGTCAMLHMSPSHNGGPRAAGVMADARYMHSIRACGRPEVLFALRHMSRQIAHSARYR